VELELLLNEALKRELTSIQARKGLATSTPRLAETIANKPCARTAVLALDTGTRLAKPKKSSGTHAFVAAFIDLPRRRNQHLRSAKGRFGRWNSWSVRTLIGPERRRDDISRLELETLFSLRPETLTAGCVAAKLTVRWSWSTPQ